MRIALIILGSLIAGLIAARITYVLIQKDIHEDKRRGKLDYWGNLAYTLPMLAGLLWPALGIFGAGYFLLKWTVFRPTKDQKAWDIKLKADRDRADSYLAIAKSKDEDLLKRISKEDWDWLLKYDNNAYREARGLARLSYY